MNYHQLNHIFLSSMQLEIVRSTPGVFEVVKIASSPFTSVIALYFLLCLANSFPRTSTIISSIIFFSSGTSAAGSWLSHNSLRSNHFTAPFGFLDILIFLLGRAWLMPFITITVSIMRKKNRFFCSWYSYWHVPLERNVQDKESLGS